MRSFVYFSILLMLLGFNLKSQNKIVDSLQNLLLLSTSDTQKIRLRFDIGQYGSIFRIPFLDSLRADCEVMKKRADEKSTRVLSLYHADILNNIGFVYYNQGNIEKALEFLSSSLKIQEQIGHKQGASTTINNIAYIYLKQGDDKSALDNFFKCLKLREEIGEESKIAQALMNIGLIYRNSGEAEKALEYYTRSLKMHQTADPPDKLSHATTLYNLAALNLNTGKIEEAMKYYDESMKMQKEIGDNEGLSFAYNDLGSFYLSRKNYSKAIEFCKLALHLGEQIGYPELIRNASDKLSTIYKEKGDFKNALNYYEVFIKMRDSLNNENTRRASIKTKLEYDYGKKMAADSVVRAKSAEITAAQLAKQKAELNDKRNQQYALFGGLAVVLVFAGVIYGRFRITQKQKKIIELQKSIVEEKQKEILDSIYYARRIQRALITSERYIRKNLSRLHSK